MNSINTKKLKNLIALSSLMGTLLTIPLQIQASGAMEEEFFLDKNQENEGHFINFRDVPIIEFV